MSNIINFNCREFRIDEKSKDSVGSRVVLTDFSGKNSEVYELGTWTDEWSQIICDKCLEPDTDYVFRFAMTGGYNDLQNETSRCIIFPRSRLNEQITYPLEKSRFGPVVSKQWDKELLRVYEIPFNTGNYLDWCIVLVSCRAVSSFFPARENEYYSSLKNMTYDEWWRRRTISPDFTGKRPSGNFFGFDPCKFAKEAEKKHKTDNFFGFGPDIFAEEAERFRETTSKWRAESFPFGIDPEKVIEEAEKLKERASKWIPENHIEFDADILNEEAEKLGKEAAKFADAIGEAFRNFTGLNDTDNSAGSGAKTEISNENLTESEFAAILCAMENNGCLSLSNTNISDGAEDEKYNFGGRCDRAAFHVSNVNMGEGCFSILAAKFGDSCDVTITNANITKSEHIPYNFSGNRTDGITINLSNVCITASALSAIILGLGDGSILRLDSCAVTGENTDSALSANSSDNLLICVSNTYLPGTINDLIKSKLGGNCTFNVD